MFNAIGQGPEGKGLGTSDRLGRVGAISKDTRKVGDLGQPAAIFFLFHFNG